VRFQVDPGEFANPNRVSDFVPPAVMESDWMRIQDYPGEFASPNRVTSFVPPAVPAVMESDWMRIQDSQTQCSWK